MFNRCRTPLTPWLGLISTILVLLTPSATAASVPFYSEYTDANRHVPLNYPLMQPTDPTGVILIGFDGIQQGNIVHLTWETSTELSNRGFNLYRGASLASWDIKLNETLIPSQAQGSPNGFFYELDDGLDLTPGEVYWYWLEDINMQGGSTLTGPIGVLFTVPTAVEVSSLQAAAVSGNTPVWLASSLLAVLVLSLAAWSSRRNMVHNKQ